MKTINCKITRPEYTVKDLRVIAFEESLVAVNTIYNISRASSKLIREIGYAFTNSNGNCEIRFDLNKINSNFSTGKSKIFIRVFEGEQLLGESSRVSINEKLNFEWEVGYAPSPPPKNQTIITVIDDNDEPVAFADVYWRGLARGKTDHLGKYFLYDVQAGDTIAVRLLMSENKTTRNNHDQLSDQNWNYRVYCTSVVVQHDAAGNNVSLPLHVVTEPHTEQIVRLSYNNTQIAFNIVVSFEWDATIQELIYYRDRFFETAELLFNSTDGQFLIEHLAIADNKTLWNDADFRIYTDNKQPSQTSFTGAFFGNSGYISMNPVDAFNAGALLHELGHYAFALGDEAKGMEGCTYEGVNGHHTVFSENGEKEACIMRGDAVQFRAMKICGAHPDNPHVHGTNQGNEDCWSSIKNRFQGQHIWNIYTPQSRNAIVGKLPDSGVALATITTRPPTTAPALSFIPVFMWKPQWYFDDFYEHNELHNFKVRILYYGEPENNARVTIKNAAGHIILEGLTGPKDRPYRDGLAEGDGEIIIRGAHTGDTLTITSQRLLVIEIIQLSGSNLTYEINFQGWEG